MAHSQWQNVATGSEYTWTCVCACVCMCVHGFVHVRACDYQQTWTITASLALKHYPISLKLDPQLKRTMLSLLGHTWSYGGLGRRIEALTVFVESGLIDPQLLQSKYNQNGQPLLSRGQRRWAGKKVRKMFLDGNVSKNGNTRPQFLVNKYTHY